MLVWKAFDFIHQSEGESCWETILCYRLFSFITLHYAISFWLVEFLLQNQQITLWKFPCTSFVIFFPCCCNILSFCQFDYCVSLCVPLWVYSAWDSLCFLDLADCFFSHIGEVFSYYLFKYYLWSFPSLLLLGLSL